MRRLVLLPLAVLLSCMDGSPTAAFDLPAKDEALGTGKAATLTGVLDTSASGGIVSPSDQMVALVGEKGRETRTTAEAGAFAFPSVAPGDYHLVVNLTGFARVDRTVTLTGGQTVDVGTLALEWLLGKSSGGVLGKVVVPGGDALQARVEALGQPGGERLALVAPAADGSFLAPLPPGTYKLRAVHPLFKPYTTETAFVVDGGKTLDLTATPLVLELNPATLSGTVYEEVDGAPARPAAGVSVTLKLGGATTTTDAQGRFNLGQLVGQPNVVLLAKDGYHQTAPVEVALAPGQAGTLARADLWLDRARLTGDVELNDQTDLGLVQVRVDGTGHAAVAQRDPAARNKGHFVVENVPPGTYAVVAARQDYADATASPVVVKGHLATIPVTLPRLVRQGGDFRIEDADPSNTPGFTAKLDVSLVFANLAGAACVRASETQAGLPAATCAAWSGAPIAFRLDGAAADGRRTVYAQYENAAGTSGPVLSSSVVLDRAAPTGGKVVLEGGAGFTKNSSTLAAQLEAFDENGVALMRLSVDGAQTAGVLDATAKPFDRLAAVTRAATGDGAQDVFAQFFDPAGNASPIAKATVVVDTAAPSGTVSLVGPPASEAGFTNAGLVQLARTVAAEPNGGYVRLYAGNSALERDAAGPIGVPAGASQSAWPLDTASEGAKQVFVKLVDAAGNEAALSPASITYDRTPPSLSFSIVQGTLVSSPGVTAAVSASDGTTGSGLAPTPLLLSEAADFAGATPVALPPNNQLPFSLTPSTGPTDEDRFLNAQVRDRAGNTTTRSVRLTLDQTKPSGRFTIVGALADGTPSSTTTTSLLVRLDVTGLDGAAKMLFSNTSIADCAAAQGYAPLTASVASYNLAAGTAGDRTVFGCLEDAAGNAFALAPQTIAYVTAAPSCTLAITGTLADASKSTSLTAFRDVDFSFSGCTADATEMAVSGSALACATAAYVPRTPSGVAALAGGDGAGKQLFACLRGPARLATAAAIASTNALKLDTQAPLWTAPLTLVNAPLGAVNTTLLVTDYAAADNLDAPSLLKVAFTQSAVATAADCAALPWVAYNPRTTTHTLAPAVSGTTYTLYACFKDLAGNISPPPAIAWPKVTYDTGVPAAPAPNLPVSIAGGMDLSWSDSNPDSARVEVQYSKSATFAGTVYTVPLASQPSGTCSPRVAPRQSMRLLPPAIPAPLENYANWYFRARVWDCAGNPSAWAGFASGIPNVGVRPFSDAAPGQLRLFADGSDLWAYSTSADGSGIVLRHCAASNDCRLASNWATSPVAVAAAGSSLVGAASMFADADNLYVAATTGSTSFSTYTVDLAWCPRTDNCDLDRWKRTTLRTLSGVGRVSPAVGLVTSRAVLVGYISSVRDVTAGATPAFPKISVSRCVRSSPAGCSQPANWAKADFDLAADFDAGLTVGGVDQPFYGFKAVLNQTGGCKGTTFSSCIPGEHGGDLNLPRANGEPSVARCDNACADESPCSWSPWGYNCGDLNYARLNYSGATGTLAGDALTPQLMQVGGNTFSSWVQRSSTGVETVYARVCTQTQDCTYPGNFLAPFALFQTFTPTSQRPNVALTAFPLGRTSARANVAWADPGSGKLFLATCDTSPTVTCGSLGQWRISELSSGLGAEVQPSTANSGANLFVASGNAASQGQVLAPIIAAPVDFYVGPKTGGLEFGWRAAESSLGTNVFHQPGAAPAPGGAWANSVQVPDPFVNRFQLSAPASSVRAGAVQSFGTWGVGEASPAWTAAPFALVPALNATPVRGEAVSVASAGRVIGYPGSVNGGSVYPYGGALTPDPTVFAAYASPAGLQLGRCNPSTATCGTLADWTWASLAPVARTVNSFSGDLGPDLSAEGYSQCYGWNNNGTAAGDTYGTLRSQCGGTTSVVFAGYRSGSSTLVRHDAQLAAPLAAYLPASMPTGTTLTPNFDVNGRYTLGLASPWLLLANNGNAWADPGRYWEVNLAGGAAATDGHVLSQDGSNGPDQNLVTGDRYFVYASKAWTSLQLSVDYPRDWLDGRILAGSKPRLFLHGRIGGTQPALRGCDLSKSACAQDADFAFATLGSSSSPAAQTTVRAVGDYVQTTETDASGAAVVRYCDGGAPFRNMPGTTAWVRAYKIYTEVQDASRPSDYCSSQSSWLNSPPLGSNGRGTAGVPHPSWGWVAAQSTASGISLWMCPRTRFYGNGLGYCTSNANCPAPETCGNGQCVWSDGSNQAAVYFQQVDCTNAANWRERRLPGGAYPTALDMTVATRNYQPFTLGSAQGLNSSDGVFLSYYDRGWRVASCRGQGTAADEWVCTQAASWPPAGPKQYDLAANWSSAFVAPGQYAPVASSIRSVNGDLVATFVENGRVITAICGGGAACASNSSWRYVVSYSGFSASAQGAAGHMTGDALGNLYELLPNGTGGAALLAHGQFGSP